MPRGNYRRAPPKKTTTSKLAAKVARIDKRTKVEYKKLYNRTATASLIDWGGGINSLSSIPSSIDDNSKIGNEIRAINLSFRYSIFAGAIPTRVRVIVLRDYSNELTIPVEWLRYAGTLTAVDSPREDKYLHYGKTLMDKTYSLSPNGTAVVGATRILKIDKTLQFDDGTSDCIVNPIKLLVISDVDDGAASVNKPAISFTTVLSYTDN